MSLGIPRDCATQHPAVCRLLQHRGLACWMIQAPPVNLALPPVRRIVAFRTRPFMSQLHCLDQCTARILVRADQPEVNTRDDSPVAGMMSLLPALTAAGM